MQKTRKKHENTIRKALTEICETALVELKGFKWFSYEFELKFPEDLQVICAFENQELITELESSGEVFRLHEILAEGLKKHGVRIKDIRNHIRIETDKKPPRDRSA